MLIAPHRSGREPVERQSLDPPPESEIWLREPEICRMDSVVYTFNKHARNCMKKDRYCLQGVHDLIFAMTIKLQHTVLNIFGANYQFLFSEIKKHSKPM